MKQEKKTDAILLVYLGLILGIFPLFYRNYYYNIQESKSLFFTIVTLVLGTVFFVVAYVEYGFTRLRKCGKIYPAMSIVLVMFWGWALLSACLCDNRAAAFSGENGRYMGVVWIGACVVAFLVSSRLRNSHLMILTIIIATASTVVILLGSAHAVGIDIGGFMANVPDRMRGRYYSTIGNINYFCQYASFMAVILSGAFCVTRKKWMLVFVGISYFGVLLGNSDMGVLGLGGTMMLFPLVFGTDWERVDAMLECAIMLVLACGAMKLIQPRTVGVQELTMLLKDFLLRTEIIIAMAIVAVGLWVLWRLWGKKCSVKRVRRIYGIILLAGAAVGITAIVLANMRVLDIPVLVMSDTWGTNRGYVWRKILELYGTYAPKQKMFGCGPGQLLPLMEARYHDEMIAVTKQVFDSAHNDPLQYMITIGFPGMCFYVAFWVMVVIAGIRNKRAENKIWLMGAVCYLWQFLMVPCQPMTTPFAFIFAGLGMAEFCDGRIDK